MKLWIICFIVKARESTEMKASSVRNYHEWILTYYKSSINENGWTMHAYLPKSQSPIVMGLPL